MRPEINRRILPKAGGKSGLRSVDYRDEHLLHHSYLGDSEKERDSLGIKCLRLEEPLTTSELFRHLAVQFLGEHFPYYVGTNLTDRDGRLSQKLKAALLLFTIAFSLVHLSRALYTS